MFPHIRQVLPRADSYRENSLDRSAAAAPPSITTPGSRRTGADHWNEGDRDASGAKGKGAAEVSLRPGDLRNALQLQLHHQKQEQDARKSLWWSSFKARSGVVGSRDSSGYTWARWLRGSARRVGVSLGLTRHHRLVKQKQLLSAAQAGDILLLNVGQSFEGRMVPLGLIRGIVSTTDTHFLPKTAAVDPWNDIGVVVLQPDGSKHLLFVDSSGISIRGLDDILSLCAYRNITCALRPLTIKKDKEQTRRRQLNQSLLWVVQQLQGGRGVQWSQLKPSSPMGSPQRAALSLSTDGEEEAAAGQVAPLIGLLQHVLHRVARVVAQPSPDQFSEVMRVFFVLDEEKKGTIELEKLRNMLLKPAAGAGAPADGAAESPDEPTGLEINTGGEADNNNNLDNSGAREQTGANSDTYRVEGAHPEADGRLIQATERMLNSMHLDSAGVITINEFLDSYIKASHGAGPDHGAAQDDAVGRMMSSEEPRPGPAREHDGNIDLPAVAKGEFVGALLLYLGVLQEHHVADSEVLASEDSCESPGKRQNIVHSSALAAQMDLLLPRRTHGFFTPSTFSSTGPPEGHQGVDLTSLLMQYRASGLSSSHWIARGVDEGVYLKSLIGPLHVVSDSVIAALLKKDVENSKKDMSTCGRAASEVAAARRGLAVRLCDSYAFEPELFLSRNL